MQLRREISYKVAFNRGCERWLHSLLRAISSNREFVYYSCSRCNRRRFWSKSLIHNFHINHSAACLHPKFCISLCSISLGMTVVPRRNCKQCSCQMFFFFLGGGGGRGGQRALWSMWKWRMAEWGRISYIVLVFYKQGVTSLTASLNKYLIRSIFYLSGHGSENPRKLLWKRQNKRKHRKTGVTKIFNSI